MVHITLGMPIMTLFSIGDIFGFVWGGGGSRDIVFYIYLSGASV